MRFCTVSACLHVRRPRNLPRRLSGCGRRSGFRLGPVSSTPRWPSSAGLDWRVRTSLRSPRRRGWRAARSISTSRPRSTCWSSWTRPIEDELGEHPLAGFVIAAIAEAQAAGRVSADADPGALGVIFLTGLFALLATGATASRERAALLDRYVLTIV